MNWIDIIWALLTLFSAGAFHMRKWLINHKMRLLNYSLFSILIISVAESLQTISRLSPIGSALHMLTYVLQASLVSYGVYHTWEKQWFSIHQGSGSSRNPLESGIFITLTSGLILLFFA
ncbi:hypothetical protein P2G42_13110 [Klebsiella electrica]|uniref:hypothetical protein n=1 Tax=Klebsiella electrica TaxID=1259973 RepID=UPI0025568EEB|nr:hypothetical protein [Klebsiella electrica]WIO40913.1 hypothetical protein P2G42_13110 [Klebsiella electrica]